jgi:hypothetical protein
MNIGYENSERHILQLIEDIKKGKGYYDLMELCFKEHIDVFGLVENGLAININTLK